jgi:hypothetical protein
MGAVMTAAVASPGVYDMPEDEYHANPALSSSGARKLLPPSCPAIYRWERDNGQPHKPEFDFGHAAHMVVLGVGPELYVVGADDWRTKAVKEERDEAYARGAVPLLPTEFDVVQAMAAALRAHPRASELFADGGVAEQSLLWTDRDTGVACRARPDWMASDRLVDYKTTTNVSPGHISRAVENFGYHQQADWYLTAGIELDLIAPDAEFLFVFQAKTPPYLVTVVDLDDVALKIGRDRNQRAREIFADCVATDVWPAYSDDIETVSLPAYAERRHHYEGI